MWKPIIYSDNLLDAMLEMAQENYGAQNDTANREFIKHQYFANPAGNAIINLAWDEQAARLAGQYSVCPMRFRAFCKQKVVTNSLNTLTQADYRGQGIFTGLAEITYERETGLGHAFCYGIPNPNSHPGFLKKLAFVELGKLPLYLRPLCPSAMVAQFTGKKTLGACAAIGNPFFHARSIKEREGLQIVPLTHQNMHLADALWVSIQDKYPVMNIRDRVFLQFRYLDMPGRTYFPFIALREGIPVAFAVGRIMEVAGMQCGMLADFVFAEGATAESSILLSFMLNHLQGKGASVAGTLMLSHTQEAVVLHRNGFICCPQRLEPQPFPLIIRLFDDSLRKKGILDSKNWFFTMGDYDVI